MEEVQTAGSITTYSYTTCGLGGRNVALRDGQAGRVGCDSACYLLESLLAALKGLGLHLSRFI